MSESEEMKEEPSGEIEGTKRAELYADWQVLMSKDKGVETDTKGAFADYPSHLACNKKVEELITGTKFSYYQYITYKDSAIGIETVITHASGEILPTGIIYIPIVKKEALGIATAIGWAKRLSLVHAFSLGTLEREVEPKSWAGINNTGGMAPPFKPGSYVNIPTSISTTVSIEDMEDDLPEPTIDERIAQINSVFNVDALNRLYRSFPKDVQDDQRIIDACADRKLAMTVPPDSLPPLIKT